MRGSVTSDQGWKHMTLLRKAFKNEKKREKEEGKVFIGVKRLKQNLTLAELINQDQLPKIN